MKRPYKICRLDDEGQWVTCASYTSLLNADEAMDNWCNEFPHAAFTVTVPASPNQENS